MLVEGFLRMKIATFNINNINKRLDNLVAWLAKSAAGRRLPPGAQGRAAGISGSYPSKPWVIVQSGKASVPGTAWRSSRETMSRC